MNNAIEPIWHSKRTDESRHVEEVLRQAGYDRADAYRYNAASIRVRVIDSRFENMASGKRIDLIEPILESLPEETQADIITLYTFAPSELDQPRRTRADVLNFEFEEPSPSML